MLKYLNPLNWFSPSSLTVNDLGKWFDTRTQDGAMSVTAHNALNYAPVFQCVNMISGDIAKQKLDLFRLSGESKEKDTANKAYRVVKRPSEYVSAQRFWKDYTFHYLFWGNAYAWIERDSTGRPRSLMNLRPDKTVFDPEKEKYLYEIDNEVIEFDRRDVLHCRYFAVPGDNEPHLLKNAKVSWSIGLAAQGHAAKFFTEGCNIGGILNVPSAIPKDKRKNIIEGWDNSHKGKSFKVAILTDGVQFHRVALNAEESQFDETRIHQAREVANWFNVPVSKLGIPDSGGYGSRTEDNRNYLEQTLTPILCEFASECDIKLLSPLEQRNDSHFFKHDTRDLMRPDAASLANIHRTYWEIGALNANEIREDIGKNPREGGESYTEPNANHKLEGSEEQGEQGEDTSSMSPAFTDMLQNELDLWVNSTKSTIDRQRSRKDPERFQKWLAEWEPSDYKYREQAEKAGLDVPTTGELKC